MPGLIICSWSSNNSEKAQHLFDKARAALTRIQGLPCTAEETGPSYRLARFTSPKSQHPSLAKSKDGRYVMGAAGWCYHPTKEVRDWLSPADSGEQSPDWDHVLDKLQGQYVAAIADRTTGEVIVAGDQLGICPLYMTEKDGIAWASTSSMALVCALGGRLDLQALWALFMDDEIRSPRSAFEGIRRSSLGERHSLANGRFRTRRVWVPFREPKSYAKLNDAVDEGIDVLHKTCRSLRTTWPRNVADLTSGLDSRLVVGMMATCGEPVHLTVNGRPDDRDVIAARHIAERLQWPITHNEYPTDWGQRRWEFFQKGVALSDGEKPGHMIERTLWAKTRLSSSYDASTGGSAGEFYRDFFWHQEFARIGKTSHLDLKRLLRYRLTFNSNPEKNLFRSNWWDQYEDSQVSVMQDIVNMAPDALNSAKLDAIYIWYFSGHSGRYGAAASAMIASPFVLLTSDAMAYAIAVPWQYRMHGKLMRHMTTKAHPKLASMPTWHGATGEPITIKRPLQYVHYNYRLLVKLARKAGQLTLRNSRVAPPMVRVTLPVYNTDFVKVLAKEGLLNADNLVTKNLYNTDYLKDFLQRATREDFQRYTQLYTIVSIELACRLCGISTEGQSF